MKWFLLGFGLLLAGCCETESMSGQVYARPAEVAPAGCRLVGTVRDAEGGGLSSYEHNRSIVEGRLRQEAARLGGDSLAVVKETRGDTDDGYAAEFQTGVPGLGTPASPRPHRVALDANVLQCRAPPPPPVRPAAPPRDDCTPAAPSNGQPPDDDDWNACLHKRGLQQTGSR